MLMRKTKAFTLIELLVVIAIIALLLSIVMPSLKKAKERAREVICRSNLREVGLAILLYLDNNDNWTYDFPNWWNGNEFFWTDPATGDYLDPLHADAYWGLAYKDYADNPKVFGCPSFMRVAKLIYSVDPESIREAAYGLNDYFNNKKVSEIRNPSQFIIAHDHVEPKFEEGSPDMFHNDGSGTDNLTDYRESGFRQEYYRGIFRHNIRFGDDFCTGGRANILWLDCHVSSLEETTGDDVRESWYTGI
jgi:prepilin-type N-terminal cleavage/methylation domain-containing protein/prepilin-type processing-associated H-X9-DG protein